MNVLITSAGRRVGLLRGFQTAARARGGRVWVGEMDALAPACFLADEVAQLPHVRSEIYPKQLCELVEAHRIRLLVPTIDTELARLADLAPELSQLGCLIAGSTPEFVQMTGDKWETFQAAIRHGIPTIPSWLPGVSDGLPEHLFVKPRAGSSSQHIYRTTRGELADILPRVPDPIVQSLIEGDEITIDCLFDFEGTLLHFVPRRRIRTVGGESIQGVTLRGDALNAWLEQMLPRLGRLGARGAVTAQVFQTQTQGEKAFLLMEVNPRFGGGYPLSLAAGARYPEWLLDLADGEPVPARLGDYQTGLYMTRHYEETITANPAWS